MEVDGGQGYLPRIANINRRLVMSQFALGKLGTNITPMTRATGIAIIPIMFVMFLSRGTTRDQDKRAADNSSKARCSHAGPPHNASTKAAQMIKKSSRAAGRGSLPVLTG